MEYKDKVVIVTGGAQGIGKCIAEEFRKQEALVEVIDKQEGLDHFVGDLSNRYAIEEFTKLVIEKYGKVDFIVNNALPLMKGIDECSYEEFEYALKVGVTAPFYMVKLLKHHLAEGASIVNISSSRDRMSQPQTETAKQVWDALTCGGFNALYDEGCAWPLRFSKERPPEQSINEKLENWLGMEIENDNWNEGLDREWSKDLHLIQPFHNLYDHCYFSLYDLIYVREFNLEVHVEFDDKVKY